MTAHNVRVIDAARRLIDDGSMDDDGECERPSTSQTEALERLYVGVLRAHPISCGCDICFPSDDGEIGYHGER